jgi:hypothetical protein
MKATQDSSLDGFEQRLLGELRRFVELRAAAQAPSHDRLTTRRPLAGRLAMTPGRWMTAGATAVVIGCIMALIGFSSGSAPSLAQAFPILAKPAISTPETLQRFLNSSGTQLSDAPRYARARAFTTPWGTGYVLLDQHANLICLAAPGIDHSWGAGCGTASRAKRNGVGGGIYLAYNACQCAEYVSLLPRGATATAQEQGAKTRRLPLPDGVLTLVMHHPTYITTHIDARASTTLFTPPSTPQTHPTVVSPARPTAEGSTPSGGPLPSGGVSSGPGGARGAGG